MWLPRLFPEGWLSKVTAGAWVHCYLPVAGNGVRRESALSYCPPEHQANISFGCYPHT